MTIVKFQRVLTKKLYRQELLFLCSDDALYFFEVSRQYLEQFSSYGMDTKLQFSNVKGE